MNNDLYSILGVAQTATTAEIKEHFRFLSHAYHPDKFATPTQRSKAEEQFKQINEAYRILADPASREYYDSYRPKPPDAAPWDDYQPEEPETGTACAGNANVAAGSSLDRRSAGCYRRCHSCHVYS